MIIDMHNHYVPTNGAGSGTLPSIEREQDGSYRLVDASGHTMQLNPELTDLNKQRERMKQQGVDQRVLAVPPFCFQYEAPVAAGIAWTCSLNEGIAEAVHANPDEFTGFGTVPLQDIAAAVTELDRCINELHLRGIEIATNINGVELDDPVLNPFWERLEAHGVPLLIHPHYVAGVQRMKEYHLRNLVGNPLETALAATRLIFGGVLDRHPGLKVILSHGGGALPSIMGRLEHGRNVRPECSVDMSIIDQMRRFYYDTIVFDPAVLRWLVQTVGASQVVIGTDAPFDMSDEQPIGTVEAADLGEDAKRAILENGAGLLAGAR